MWRSKKLIIATALAAVIVAGSIGGVVLAADDGDESQPEAGIETLLDRVLAIYEQNTGQAIDRAALTDAFAQAKDEMRTDALQKWLQSLVEQDKISQSQADEYFQWQQARPDFPAEFGLRGHGGFRGMRGCFGWGGAGTFAR